MENRKILKTSYFKSFNNEYRRRIFDLCKEPRNFTELKNLLEISTGALVHHLKVLEEEGLIKKEYEKEDKKFKVGKEIKITSVSEQLEKVMEAEKRFAQEHFQNSFPKELQIKILELLEKHSLVDKREFKKILMQEGCSMEEEVFLFNYLIIKGFITEKLELSNAGEKFLKENATKN